MAGSFDKSIDDISYASDAFKNQLKSLFKPYEAKQDRSNGFKYPPYHLLNTLSNFWEIAKGCKHFLGTLDDDAGSAFSAFPGMFIQVCSAVLNVLNFAVSMIALLTRSIATLAVGTNTEQKKDATKDDVPKKLEHEPLLDAEKRIDDKLYESIIARPR